MWEENICINNNNNNISSSDNNNNKNNILCRSSMHIAIIDDNKKKNICREQEESKKHFFHLNKLHGWILRAPMTIGMCEDSDFQVKFEIKLKKSFKFELNWGTSQNVECCNLN